MQAPEPFACHAPPGEAGPRRPPRHPSARVEVLKGLGVLVTRPAAQAEPLVERIEALGGRALRFPVIEIATCRMNGPLERVLTSLDAFDLAVFISVNAVRYGLPLARTVGGWPDHLAIAAIGESTARALAEAGIALQVRPKPPFNTESLLETAAMQAGAISGKRVIIFRGVGGRELLGQRLTERGATVAFAEVYRRVKPERATCSLPRDDVDVVVVTSAEGVRNLFELAGPRAQSWLKELPFVTVSARVSDAAQALGVRRAPLVSTQAGDEGIVETLCRWAVS